MGCCSSTPLNPDIPVEIPAYIKRLNSNSDPAILKQVEDVMTKAFTGSNTSPPEPSIAWCFDPDGNVDDDYSKPLKAPPTKEREDVLRFIIKFGIALSGKHNSIFALFEEDEYGKATDVVVGATCIIPPNTTNLHDPGMCEFIALGLTSPPPTGENEAQRGERREKGNFTLLSELSRGEPPARRGKVSHSKSKSLLRSSLTTFLSLSSFVTASPPSHPQSCNLEWTRFLPRS
jgi:hypothetical protein